MPITPKKETHMRSILIAAVAATAVAIPATALASHGADDGASATTSATATTTAPATTTPSRTVGRLTATERRSAIAAARAVVPAAARVTKVEKSRRSSTGKRYEVKLRTASTRYKVKLNGAFAVLDVDREAIGGGADDGPAHDAGDDHGGARGGSGSGRNHPEDD